MSLPSINDLYKEDISTENQNKLNVLLNQQPKKEWLKDHPYAKKKVNGKVVPVQYLPIERLEYLMTRIFIKWHVEVLDFKLIGNSVCTHVRVYFLDPITSAMRWTDGVGACALQTDEGSGAIDFNKLKSDAVMKALPASKSYAFKDAVETLGILFGRDLNRKENIGYEGLINSFKTSKQDKRVLKFIQEAKDLNQLKEVVDLLETQELIKEYNNKQRELNGI